MRKFNAKNVLLLGALVGLAACVQPYPAPLPEVPPPLPVVADTGPLPPRAAAENFLAVVAQVEPVAETYCHRLGRAANCDFRIVVDDRPGQPANAFQTLDNTGRPVLALTVALLKDARNRDELAFVIGHEAAHHIAGHLPQKENSAIAGAILGGILAAASGAGEQGVAAAQDLGAEMGALRYSQDFELEADALGAEIALRAGFDPMRGVAFFDRLPDPGDSFLSSHPGNARRKQMVAATVARLQR